jgi:hypothetical protein
MTFLQIFLVLVIVTSVIGIILTMGERKKEPLELPKNESVPLPEPELQIVPEPEQCGLKCCPEEGCLRIEVASEAKKTATASKPKRKKKPQPKKNPKKGAK